MKPMAGFLFGTVLGIIFWTVVIIAVMEVRL